MCLKYLIKNMMITMCIDNPHLPTVFKNILRLRMDADYPYTNRCSELNTNNIYEQNNI